MTAKYQIVLSYSSQDEVLVNRISLFLEKNNISCWVAHKQLNTTEIWAAEIVNAINLCEIFVVVLTKNSNVSNQVMKELTIADNLNKILYFFQVEKIEISAGISYFCTANQRNEVYKIGMDKALERMSKELLLNLSKSTPVIKSENDPPTKKPDFLEEQKKVLNREEKVSNEDLKKIKGSSVWENLNSPYPNTTKDRLKTIIGTLVIIAIISGIIYWDSYRPKALFYRNMDEGNARLEKKDFDGAWSSFKFAYDSPGISSEDSIKASLKMAFCELHDILHPERAKEILYSVIFKDRNNYIPYLYLGYIMNEKNRNLDSAIYFFSKAIELDSTEENFYAYFNRGDAKSKLHDTSAKSDFEKAKKIDASEFSKLKPNVDLQ